MSAKTNLIVGTAIFGAFLVAFEPRLTGIAIHEWLSLALAATIIVHLVLHWDWVIQVARKFIKKLFHMSRLNFLVDTVLFVAMILVMLSGILISRSVVGFFGIQINASHTWQMLHSWSADITLILVGLHFALHWKWIMNTVKRYAFSPIVRLFQRATPANRQVTAVVVDEQ